MHQFRTWEDFVILAYEKFGSDADALLQRMAEHGITRRQVECYINWVWGMSQEQLGMTLGITQPVVCRHLKKLREKWPALFDFTKGTPIPDMLSLSDHISSEQIIHKF